jgi:hypothetical protein
MGTTCYPVYYLDWGRWVPCLKILE